MPSRMAWTAHIQYSTGSKNGPERLLAANEQKKELEFEGLYDALS
jgi:hypothetical protein